MGINHDHFMRQALQLAEQATTVNEEVPVGAIVVKDGDIIGSGYNQPIGQTDPTAHAEIVALREASGALSNYRLLDCDLYVTLEPCIMCLGAMSHARIRRCYFGSFATKGSVVEDFRVHIAPKVNHRLEILGGILEQPCSELLSSFFAVKRLE